MLHLAESFKKKKKIIPPQLKYYFIAFFFLLYPLPDNLDHSFLTLNSHRPTPLTHVAIDLACLPSFDPPLLPTQAPSPKSQADPRRHHPPHPSSKPSSVYLLFSPKLSVQSTIADPCRPHPIVVFVCVFLCCCRFCFVVIQKILNFLKFCL